MQIIPNLPNNTFLRNVSCCLSISMVKDQTELQVLWLCLHLHFPHTLTQSQPFFCTQPSLVCHLQVYVSFSPSRLLKNDAASPYSLCNTLTIQMTMGCISKLFYQECSLIFSQKLGLPVLMIMGLHWHFSLTMPIGYFCLFCEKGILIQNFIESIK